MSKAMVGKAKKYLAVLITLILLSLISSALYLKNFLCLGDLWLNLLAGFITLIATIFVVDTLIEKRRNQELDEANVVMVAELWMIANKMSLNIVRPFGYDIESHFDAITPRDSQINKVILEISKAMKRGTFLKEQMPNTSLDKWKHFELNLLEARMVLDQFFTLYQRILPVELLGKLFKSRKAFIDFYNFFGYFAQTFVHNPINDLELKKMMIDEQVKLLPKHFSALTALIVQLESYEKNR